MYLAQDRNKWRALVNTVMDLQVPYKAGKFLNRRLTINLPRKVCTPWSNLLALFVSYIP
jgi:hypothetical protein